MVPSPHGVYVLLGTIVKYQVNENNNLNCGERFEGMTLRENNFSYGGQGETQCQDLQTEEEPTEWRMQERGFRLRSGTRRHPGVRKGLACVRN